MSSRNRKYIVDVLSSAGAKRFAVPISTEERVFALLRDTSKAQFVTRSHSNSKSHARARPKSFRESLPNEASVVMMRRVRVGFYTLRYA